MEYKSCVEGKDVWAMARDSLQLRLYAYAYSMLRRGQQGQGEGQWPVLSRVVLESIEDGRAAHLDLQHTDTTDR